MADSQIIQVPGVGDVEFPSSMSDAEIVTAVKRLHLNSQIPNPKQFEKSMPGDESDDVLHPKPILGQKVADVLNKPLIDAPLVGPLTSPASIMLMGAGAAANGVGRGPVSSGLQTAGGALSKYSLSRPLEPIGDLMAHVGDKMAQPPRPVFGSGGAAPTERGPLPQTGGPIQIPQRPVFGSGGSLPMDRGPIPTGGGPIQVQAPPQTPQGPTAMSPRVVGKAPGMGDALLDAIKGVQTSQEPAKAVTLPPAPGSDMTGTPGGYVSKEMVGGPGRKKGSTGKYGGYTSGSPSKPALSDEPPTTVSETIGDSPKTQEPQPEYVKQMMDILKGATGEPTKPTSALADLASKTSRERSPLSLNDQERLMSLLTEEQKAEFLKLRAEGQQGHVIHGRMDAAARAAAEREQ